MLVVSPYPPYVLYISNDVYKHTGLLRVDINLFEISSRRLKVVEISPQNDVSAPDQIHHNQSYFRIEISNSHYLISARRT